jgi:hypothetical protein
MTNTTSSIEGVSSPSLKSENAVVASIESGGFDPQALTTLAPGVYTLDYMARVAASGGDGEQVEIPIYSSDTWADVLLRLSSALGSASPAMLSRLVPVSRSTVSTPPTAESQDTSAAKSTTLAAQTSMLSDGSSKRGVGDLGTVPALPRTEREAEKEGPLLDVYDASAEFSLDELDVGEIDGLLRRQG